MKCDLRGDGAAWLSRDPDDEAKQKPVPTQGPVWVPRAGFAHRGACRDLETLCQALVLPGGTFEIPLKHHFGCMDLPSAAAGLVMTAQR